MALSEKEAGESSSAFSRGSSTSSQSSNMVESKREGSTVERSRDDPDRKLLFQPFQPSYSFPCYVSPLLSPACRASAASRENPSATGAAPSCAIGAAAVASPSRAAPASALAAASTDAGAVDSSLAADSPAAGDLAAASEEEAVEEVHKAAVACDVLLSSTASVSYPFSKTPTKGLDAFAAVLISSSLLSPNHSSSSSSSSSSSFSSVTRLSPDFFHCNAAAVDSSSLSSPTDSSLLSPLAANPSRSPSSSGLSSSCTAAAAVAVAHVAKKTPPALPAAAVEPGRDDCSAAQPALSTSFPSFPPLQQRTSSTCSVTVHPSSSSSSCFSLYSSTPRHVLHDRCSSDVIAPPSLIPAAAYFTVAATHAAAPSSYFSSFNPFAPDDEAESSPSVSHPRPDVYPFGRGSAGAADAATAGVSPLFPPAVPPAPSAAAGRFLSPFSLFSSTSSSSHNSGNSARNYTLSAAASSSASASAQQQQQRQQEEEQKEEEEENNRRRKEERPSRAAVTSILPPRPSAVSTPHHISSSSSSFGFPSSSSSSSVAASSSSSSSSSCSSSSSSSSSSSTTTTSMSCRRPPSLDPGEEREKAAGSSFPPSSFRSQSYKVVLLGEASVGKSSLLLRFVKDTFHEGVETTVGAAFFTHALVLPEQQRRIVFELWDTAGQERFAALAPLYYRNAAAAVVVFDITSQTSYERACLWVQQLQLSGNPDIVIALAANKIDLLPPEMGEDFQFHPNAFSLTAWGDSFRREGGEGTWTRHSSRAGENRQQNYPSTLTSSADSFIMRNSSSRREVFSSHFVNLEKASSYATENGLLFCCTSAKTGEGIQNLFRMLGRRLPEEKQKHTKDGSFKNNPHQNQPNTSTTTIIRLSPQNSPLANAPGNTSRCCGAGGNA